MFVLRKLLTTAEIEKMKTPKKRKLVPEGRLPGLYLIVQPSGLKSWCVRYRLKGRQHKFTLGNWPVVDIPTARKLATDALREVAMGRDPGAATKDSRTGISFPDALDQFLTSYRRSVRPRTLYEVERTLRRDVLPRWCKRDIAALNRADVHAVLDAQIKRDAPVTAIQTLRYLSIFFSWAINRGMIEASPTIRVKPPKSRPRERVLNDAELAALWRASEALGAPFGPALQLLILTGQRRSEVGAARWQEIAIVDRVWTLPGARTRNGRKHTVPLSAQAVAVLAGCQQSGNYVFARPLNRWSNAVDKLNRLLENDGRSPPSLFAEPWVVHDIRRSVISGMAGIGIPLHVIERAVNHVSGSFGGIVGVYQRHQFADEVRAALDAWGRHLEAIVTGERGVVVPMRKLN